MFVCPCINYKRTKMLHRVQVDTTTDAESWTVVTNIDTAFKLDTALYLDWQGSDKNESGQTNNFHLRLDIRN